MLIKNLIILLCIVFCYSCSRQNNFVVKSSNLEISLNANGEIVEAKFQNGKIIKDIEGFSSLKGCKIVAVESKKIPSNGMEFRKTMLDTLSNCIDRMDWTRFYNHKTDDGVSWMGDQPVGSMYVSWNNLMEKLNPIFHDKNKLIFVNNHVKRIEQLKYVDGIFDEFTYAGSPINTVALMCTHKPALGWMSSDQQLLPDSDEVMQKYLYMGIFPMAPFPGNDHSIRPSELADKVYLDYGPLFNLLRGKEWVLKPHVISSEQAKVNLFKTFHGYTIPVIYSGDNKVAKVVVTDNELLQNDLEITAWYPGEQDGLDVPFEIVNNELIINTPMKRQCAVLKVVMK